MWRAAHHGLDHSEGPLVVEAEHRQPVDAAVVQRPHDPISVLSPSGVAALDANCPASEVEAAGEVGTDPGRAGVVEGDVQAVGDAGTGSAMPDPTT